MYNRKIGQFYFLIFITIFSLISFNCGGDGGDNQNTYYRYSGETSDECVTSESGTGGSLSESSEKSIEETDKSSPEETTSETTTLSSEETSSNNPPKAFIDSPKNGDAFDENDTIVFTGRGIDQEDGTLSGNSLIWNSSIDGKIGTGNSFSRNNLSSGVHKITLTVTDSEGASNNAEIQITIGKINLTLKDFYSTTLNKINSPTNKDLQNMIYQGFKDFPMILQAIENINKEYYLIGYFGEKVGEKIKILEEEGFEFDTIFKGLNFTGATPVINVPVKFGITKLYVTITDVKIGGVFKKDGLTYQDGYLKGLLNAQEFANYVETETKGAITSDFIMALLSPDIDNYGMVKIDFVISGESTENIEFIEVENKAPEVTIDQPVNGAIFKLGDNILFSGRAIDREDGTIPDNKLIWKSSIDGQIGTGSTFSTDTLSQGEHTITLTATDSKGLSSQATVKIVIKKFAPNDTCDSFIQIYVGDTVSGDITDASSDYSTNCSISSNNSGNDVVYYLYIPKMISLEISVSSSYFDSVVAFGYTCGSMDSEIGCNDNAGEGEVDSKLKLNNVMPGKYYIIVKSATSKQFGQFTLSVKEILENDTCSGATPINLGETIESSTISASYNYDTTCGSQNGSPDIVYQISINFPSFVDIKAQSSEFNPVIAIQSICGSKNSEIACNDNINPYTTDALISSLYLEKGEYYIIVKGSTIFDYGKFTLTLQGYSVISNDKCENATNISVGQTINGNNKGSFSDYNVSCSGSDTNGKDVVYSLNLDKKSSLVIKAESEDFDTLLAIQKICGDEGSEISCNDDVKPGIFNSEIKLYNLESGKYYIIVKSANQYESGNFTLSISEIEPLQNDLCQNALPVEINSPVTGSTQNATNNYFASCEKGPSPDLVYLFTLNDVRSLRFNLTSSDFDPIISIQKECDDPLSEIACNNDVSESDTNAEIVLLNMTPGNYYIFVQGKDQYSYGNFTLLITEWTPVSNDVCSGALPISIGETITGNTTYASADYTSTCVRGTTPDLVYVLNVSNTISLVISLESDEFDTVLSVQKKCGDKSSEITCNDNVKGGDTNSVVTLNNLLPGKYYVVVHGTDLNNYGKFKLSVKKNIVASNDTCSDPLLVQVGGFINGSTIGASPDYLSECLLDFPSPDVVYMFDFTERKPLEIRLEGNFDTILTMQSICGNQDSAITCNDDAPDEPSNISVISLTGELLDNLPFGRYYLIVAGRTTGDFGTFRLTISK